MANPSPTPHVANFQDLTGRVFGRWTVVSLCEVGEKRRWDVWLCACECGNRKRVQLRNLTDGSSKSCGCLRAKKTGERFSKFGDPHTESVKLNPREYNTYTSMIQRGCNPFNKDYPKYGAVGRTVCDRWVNGAKGKSGFECFLLDMGKRPMGRTLDRINNRKGYYPGNCRWATPSEQAANRN